MPQASRLPAALAATLLFAFALYQALGTNNLRDFFIFRLGAQLAVRGENPYDVPRVRGHIAEQYPGEDAKEFVDNSGYFLPPLALVVFAPAAALPWTAAKVLWAVDIGLLGYGINHWLGIEYNFTRQPIAAWFTIILMDVWHWTSLVVLLAYAGLISIPDAYYQAAKIDGARPWAVFRYIQLPKMKRVLTIAVLLRFMDSFNIYTEVSVLTGGGPGNSTTLLSIDLVKIALGQFDLGPAAAMSLIYFLIILLLSWLFYTLMMRNETR